MAQRRGIRKIIKLHVLKGQIPGIGGGDPLVQGRSVARVQAEKRRALRRIGTRTGEERAEDTRYRDLGLNVFDVNSGRAQLADLIQKGRPK